MGGACRHKHGGDRDAAAIQFDGPSVISEAPDEIKLQRDVLIGGDALYVSNQLAIGDFAEGVKHHTGTAAENFLGGFGAGARNIIGNPNLKRSEEHTSELQSP